MRAKTKSFRVGKVGAVLRGRVWYLSYFEGGQRRRPRIGPDRDQARQMACPSQKTRPRGRKKTKVRRRSESEGAGTRAGRDKRPLASQFGHLGTGRWRQGKSDGEPGAGGYAARRV